MITQTIAAMTLALILAVPGLAKAEYLFTLIDVPGATRTSANGNGTRSIVGDFDDPHRRARRDLYECQRGQR